MQDDIAHNATTTAINKQNSPIVDTIYVYEKCVSLRNTIKSPYPRRVVDVPAPEVVVAICNKMMSLITVTAVRIVRSLVCGL